MFYRSMALTVCLGRIGRARNGPGVVSRRDGIPRAAGFSKATTSPLLSALSCHCSPCSESARNGVVWPAHGSPMRSSRSFYSITSAGPIGVGRPLLGMRNTCCAASAASRGQASVMDAALHDLPGSLEPCAPPGASTSQEFLAP